MIDDHDRRFVPVSNSTNGEVSPEVVFLYQQTGRIGTCRYSGGRIVSGQLIALVDAEGCLDMRYHQVNDRGELMTGVCRSTPALLPDGRIRLHEAWRWTCGDGSSGRSVVEGGQAAARRARVCFSRFTAGSVRCSRAEAPTAGISFTSRWHRPQQVPLVPGDSAEDGYTSVGFIAGSFFVTKRLKTESEWWKVSGREGALGQRYARAWQTF